MDDERKEYTFLWFIENYSYCWHDNGESLSSPEFIVPELEGTVWRLKLYPRGESTERRGNISVFLHRNEDDDGPECVTFRFKLSLLASDGSFFYSEEYTPTTFEKGKGYGEPQFIDMDEVLSRRKDDYLPQDILSVCCKLWKGDGNVRKIEQSSARTRIGIEKISFLHEVEKFSAFEPNQKETIHFRSPSKENCYISSSLSLTDGSCCEEKIIAEIGASSDKSILLKLKISLVDVSGNIIECNEVDNRFDASRKNIRKLPLTLTRELIMNRKNEYLPQDKLSLLCECIFSTGIEFEKIEEIQHAVPILASKRCCKTVENKESYKFSEKLSACSSVLEDMKASYMKEYLIDVKLKTETKTFSAHKIVLCSRSSVFKAMLSNDMMEKNTACIQVDDLENETLQQLLLFLYSDQIVNLEWESAIKLYYAGDKYCVEKLKVLCSSFLVDNISTATAIEVLLLADKRNDSYLKNFVEDFILEHEEEIFGSGEWEKLIETDPQLVIKTMYLKYKRKKGGE